jgi:hypothetical protein
LEKKRKMKTKFVVLNLCIGGALLIGQATVAASFSARRAVPSGLFARSDQYEEAFETHFREEPIF